MQTPSIRHRAALLTRVSSTAPVVAEEQRRGGGAGAGEGGPRRPRETGAERGTCLRPRGTWAGATRWRCDRAPI